MMHAPGPIPQDESRPVAELVLEAWAVPRPPGHVVRFEGGGHENLDDCGALEAGG